VTIDVLSRRDPHEYLLQAFFVKELREETCLASAVGTKNAAAITYVSGARGRLYTSKPPFKVATDNVMSWKVLKVPKLHGYEINSSIATTHF
jgi:hypothetical protein